MITLYLLYAHHTDLSCGPLAGKDLLPEKPRGDKSAVVFNTCTKKSTLCSLSDKFAYIFYLSNIHGNVKDRELRTNYTLSTYFDYAKRAIKRTVFLTDFPVILLCTSESYKACAQIRDLLSERASQIKIKQIDENIWLRPYEELKVRQKRTKLMHAYGTTQVFNPDYVVEYKRLIYMDLDTFLVRNVDELFCTEGFAAAKRPSVPLFNGGVFVYSPSKHLYDVIMKYMITYMKKPGEKKFAMQAILHGVFGQEYFCIEPTYNCGGFCASVEKCSQISTKCGIEDERELFVKASIIHSKVGEPHLRETFPSLYKLWLSYG